jgi:predicted ABC-type ATPase
VPDILIIAGPNGAGKTTFASRYLPRQQRWEYVNADEIARKIADRGLTLAARDMLAARVMLERIDHLAAIGNDFVVETTLATLIYAPRIRQWRRSGYIVSLIYLQLPSVEASLARVRRRVEAGGHGIPKDAIRRRFGKSQAYLQDIYKPIVDAWYVWDSIEGDFSLVESWIRT